MPFNKTEEFLSNIGDFTYRTAVRDLQEKPLSDKEVKTLQNLYEQSGDLKDELRNVQHTVLDENLRWMDVQLALRSEEHTSELQSRFELVCRLLLEKKITKSILQ